MAGGISGLAVAKIAAGVVLAWSGIENQTIANTLTSVLRGQAPAAGPAGPSASAASSASEAANAAAIGAATGINQTPPSAATKTALQAYAQTLLVAHGWPTEFSSLNSIIDAESSWNPNAENPSGAYGIAQALGHGQGSATAGSVTNEYGNYGTSDSICQAANSGSGTAQLEWMLNYIGEAYGSPDAAWAFHEAHGYY